MNMLKKLIALFSSRRAAPPAFLQKAGKTWDENSLSPEEIACCTEAGLSAADGLFLKKLTHSPIKKYNFPQEYSDTAKPVAICSFTGTEEAYRIVDTYLDKFISGGKYIFVSDHGYKGSKVAVLAGTTDPFRIMEYAETNGYNYDIETKDIIARYKKWERQFGIRVIGIGPDFCECKILDRNIDFQALAEEVYEFCPDVVDQGTDTVELLADEMKNSGTIYMWWD